MEILIVFINGICVGHLLKKLKRWKISLKNQFFFVIFWIYYYKMICVKACKNEDCNPIIFMSFVKMSDTYFRVRQIFLRSLYFIK